MTQLPFFVYGTLLPGQPNDGYWEDQILRSTPAVLSSVELYAFPNFPMMVKSDNSSSQVMGQVIQVNPECYTNILMELDSLENYDPADHDNSPYQRVERAVQTINGNEVLAWTYIGQPLLVKGLPQIPNGDWLTYTSESFDFISNDKWWRNRSSDKLF